MYTHRHLGVRHDTARSTGAPHLMTRDPVGRRGVGMIDSVRRLDVGAILTTILVLGLVLRVFVAGVYLPLSGFSIDIGDFTSWGQRLARLGPGAFYEAGYFSDYPPGYLYVLWLLGTVGGALAPIVGQDATGGLVKLPGILADVGVAWLLFLVARRWGGELISPTKARISPETLGLAAATVYLFNPGTIFDSAVWGQIDSVGTLILLATIYALGRGWTEAAALGAVVAMLVKFQFAFLIPIVAIIGLKRHLFGRSSDPAHSGRRDTLRVLTSLAAGVVGLTILMLPFGMFIYAPAAAGGASCLGLPAADPTTSLIGKFCEAANTYTGLSINAFNVWRNPWSGLGDTLHWGDDTVVAFSLGGLALTWQQVGVLLFGAVALLALVQVARRDDMRGVLVASLLVAIAFFVLPTRVHERYLFPALALAAPLLFAGRSWPWIYGGLSLSFFANVYWVYTEDWSFAGRIINPGAGGAPMPQDPILSATLLTDAGIWLLSLLGVVLLVAVGWHSARLAFARREAVEQPVLIAAEPEPVAVAAARAPRAADWDDDGTAPRRRAPSLRWLTPNPADAYLREPGRRLNRRDAAILVGLVAFALVFRLWRLEVPRGHHFDEVYHARSAAEFLSNWRFGWNRDVYEWTHPMLAKYLIAAGIVAVDPNQVVGSEALDAPSSALAVAPPRAAFGRDRSIAFTVAAPATIVASDAESGEEVARWEAGGPVATLAVDGEAPRLLVGLAESGSIETYELAGLLASPDGRAPPEGPPIDTGLSGIVGIVTPARAGEPMLVRGPDGIAVIEDADDAVRATAEGSWAGMALVRGVEEDGVDRVVVSDLARNELVYLDASTLEPADDGPIEVDAPLIGPLIIRGSGDDQDIAALTGPLAATGDHGPTNGGIAAVDADAGNLIGLIPLPGTPTLISHQRIANLIYVAGWADGEPQLWVVEPHVESRSNGMIGMAAYDTTVLPGTPLAMAFDVASTSQADDNGGLLVSVTGEGGGGEIVRVDAGSNAFAWRIAGVISGAILVGLVYLLAATMFTRRRIAILAAAFVAVDGMSFVMSRIAMNDIFVATFIVAAYALFWQVWSGRWARSAWWVLPLVGVLIGLAAATKWVGFYALAGLWVLVLARSDLGRLVLVGLAALAAVVGGIGAPWPFLVIMLGILALALAITWARPIRIDAREAIAALSATIAVLTGVGLAFALAFDSIEGARTPDSAIEYIFGILARGAQAGWPAWIMLGIGGALLVWRAFRSLRNPASDARWAQPGEMGGFAWSWVGASLLVVPLTVYALTYIPYLQLGHDWAIGGGPGYGWSLDELHAQMYGYHFNLTAGHDSASPWWSWPLALKPTWFFGGTGYDADQIAVIYNGGNPILFWAGIPALAVCAVLAWKRRSAALVLVVAAFAFQYVPWTRIERATFAYHYLTAVIFAMIAVAYLVDELLRRPAWRDLALGYLGLVVVVGVLIFPLGSALPMPDWYINAARSLPPWNFAFQFPDPPTGERAELLSANTLKLVAGGLVAAAAMVFAVGGRVWWERREHLSTPPPEPMAEGG
jgi:C-terminal four TMM region of protein-O-mannosyltransferase/Dolichyl-phosphate-mannose-protein mannosyltransferase/GPI transamidase subunit PIG-U